MQDVDVRKQSTGGTASRKKVKMCMSDFSRNIYKSRCKGFTDSQGTLVLNSKIARTAGAIQVAAQDTSNHVRCCAHERCIHRSCAQDLLEAFPSVERVRILCTMLT